ncbi:MAG TPA: cytochrome c oxidase assembly protein [Acidobacteriaceae bacterium]
MSDAARDLFADWKLPVWFSISLVATAIVYVRGWYALRKTRPAQFNDVRLLSFLSGLAVLWLAVASPMDEFADALLSAHMVEHLLIMSAVPPLVLYGLPVVPLLRGLPRPILHRIVAPMVRARALRRFGHRLVRPRIAWMAMNIAYLGWHIPGAYNFALEHENWHAVEHLCFLWTSILFWYCILRPWPAESRRRSWSIILYLVSADAVNSMLSAFLAFCDRPVYSYYTANPNPFGIPALQDQVLGAVVMWVVGSFFYLVPAIAITFQLLSPAPRQIRARA